LRKRVAAIEAERDTLSKEIQRLLSQFESSATSVASTEVQSHSEIESLRAELRQARADLARAGLSAKASGSNGDPVSPRFANDSGSAKEDAVKAELDKAKKEIDKMKAAATETNKELYQLKAKLNRSEKGGTESEQMKQLQSDLEEKETLIVEQDALIEEERARNKTLEAAAVKIRAELEQQYIQTIQSKEGELKQARSDTDRLISAQSSGTGSAVAVQQLQARNKDLTEQLDSLKVTFNQETEKKKQFSIVFLKLKDEFEEQKKKLALQAALIERQKADLAKRR